MISELMVEMNNLLIIKFIVCILEWYHLLILHMRILNGRFKNNFWTVKVLKRKIFGEKLWFLNLREIFYQTKTILIHCRPDLIVKLKNEAFTFFHKSINFVDLVHLYLNHHVIYLFHPTICSFALEVMTCSSFYRPRNVQLYCW